VPSAALIRWRNANLLRLDELEKAHADAIGKARGKTVGLAMHRRALNGLVATMDDEVVDQRERS